VFKLVRWP